MFRNGTTRYVPLSESCLIEPCPNVLSRLLLISDGESEVPESTPPGEARNWDSLLAEGGIASKELRLLS